MWKSSVSLLLLESFTVLQHVPGVGGALCALLQQRETLILWGLAKTICLGGFRLQFKHV